MSGRWCHYFGYFFESDDGGGEVTPPDLIELGIYRDLAVPLYDDEHGETSVRQLLAKLSTKSMRHESFIWQVAVSHLSRLCRCWQCTETAGARPRSLQLEAELAIVSQKA